MNILIENAETLEFLDGNSQWTKDITKGKYFPATQTAFAAAKKEPIGKFNIVSYVSQTRQLVNLNHGRGKGIEVATIAAN